MSYDLHGYEDIVKLCGVPVTALVAGHQSFNKYCTAAAASNPQTCTSQSQGCHILITTLKCSLLNISLANTTKNCIFVRHENKS